MTTYRPRGLRDFGLDPRDQPQHSPYPDPDPYAEMPELVIPTSLDDVDLMQEVLEQLAHAKRLRDFIATDRETPANQKAQVNNSCAQMILQLAKTQTDLYSAERMKKLEACLLKVLKSLPDETVAAFLTAYERALADV